MKYENVLSKLIPLLDEEQYTDVVKLFKGFEIVFKNYLANFPDDDEYQTEKGLHFPIHQFSQTLVEVNKFLDSDKKERDEIVNYFKYVSESGDPIYANPPVTFENLLALCNEGVRLKSDSYDSYYYRARAKYLSEDLEDAIKDLDSAIKICPNETKLYFDRGGYKDVLGDYDGCLQDYSKVIEIDPEFKDGYYNRGLAQARYGDYICAIKDLTISLEKNPLDADAFFTRGGAKTQLNDVKGAIEDFTNAIELRPEELKNYYFRGLERRLINDYQGALEDLNFLLERTTSFHDAYFFRSISKFCTADISGAIEDFEIAKLILPQPGDTNYDPDRLNYSQLEFQRTYIIFETIKHMDLSKLKEAVEEVMRRKKYTDFYLLLGEINMIIKN